MNPKIEAIVFDLGGVLVELGGVERMLNWMQPSIDIDSMWRKWLESPSVRAFESGKISAEAFASSVVDELKLSVSPEDFLEAFKTWLRALYPETSELLMKARKCCPIAVLSNTNEIHWEHAEKNWNLSSRVDHAFLSYRLGMLKPDREIFEHAIAMLALPAQSILFFDDNSLNVEAARRSGLQAHCVKGAAAAWDKLSQLGLLEAAGIAGQ